MSETRFHGARVTENTDLVTAINDVDSSVIGIVATADDADAKLFPLNKPTLLTRVNDVLGKCGSTGTLYRALKAIADQVSTKVIVVRVAEHKEEDGKTQDQLVIGGSEDDGSYTGMYALLVAEQDESIGYRPRILAAPELDTEAVTKSLCVIAGKLRAFVYATCHGCNTMAEAITYRQKFNEREVMLLWPDFIAYNPKGGKNETFPAPAYACGLRAYIDHEQGWHKSLSNVPVKNVLGMSRHVFWSLQAEDSDANSLNNKEITTIIRRNGFRFWGNRTPETNAYIFEVYNGLICPDRTWRQIVTLEDVVNHGWKHTDIDEIRDENTEDEFLNLYMCEFVREGESAFNLNILIGCGVDGYDDWKDWKPFAPRPMGNRPVWIGYDANGSSGNGDSGAVSVVVPPAVPGGRFRTVETRRVQGLEFEEQARVIEEFTYRYNVEHIGIDVTGGNGEAVYQIVKRFFPAAIPYTFTLSSKRSLVLKMLQIMRAGRWEYDRAERELVAAFNAVRKVKTPGGFITYETDRARGISHGDLAWATMLAVINEPIGGEGENERFTVMEF